MLYHQTAATQGCLNVYANPNFCRRVLLEDDVLTPQAAVVLRGEAQLPRLRISFGQGGL
jgi:hypothetical protein